MSAFALDRVKYPVHLLRSSIRLAVGLLRYAAGARDLRGGYQALVALFCLTRGWSSFVLYKLLNLFRGRLDFSRESSALPGVLAESLREKLSHLDHKGYAVWEPALSSGQVTHLHRLGLEMEMEVRTMDGEGDAPRKRLLRYDPERPVAVRYDGSQARVLADPVVQRLACDRAVLEIAQHHLGAPPILDFAAFWWNTAFSKVPDSQAAQLYHFDLDRIRWIKFFFYITDVLPENGPHCFIEGSHLPGVIPRALLRKGYERTVDEEVFRYFPKEREHVFTGKAGTMIAEDTIGLHKGQMVERGHRLILQLQYTSSLFGDMPVVPRVKPIDPELIAAIRRNPGVFSHCFDISGL